ncbi:MAG: hypothetical protein JO324_04180 [Candidatus Eremiobacteraeota bacterium]|nr:hypothetical protein [Candidatus Eremiobacteraeota bacterium]
MKFRAGAAAGTILLLAACSGSSPSAFVPGAAPPESVAASKASPSNSDARPARAAKVLYIADFDGKPGLGQIHVYTAGMKNPHQIGVITNGTGRPTGLWVDDRNYLYAANQSNLDPASVTEFKPGAASPFFKITNFMGYPMSVAVDAQHNVYVNESVQDHGFVQVFAPGSNSPLRSIDTGIAGYAFEAGSMAFDPQGNLIVAEQAKLLLHVVKIAPGSSIATPMNLNLNNITGPGLGIDKAGDIYIASSQAGTASVFAPGQTQPSRTIAAAGGYGLAWVTPDGAFYEASGESTVIEVAPGASSPTATITCTCSAQGVAVSK